MCIPFSRNTFSNCLYAVVALPGGNAEMPADFKGFHLDIVLMAVRMLFIFSSDKVAPLEALRILFINVLQCLALASIVRTNKDNNIILILGAPGTGKSTLLHQLSHYTASKNPIEIISGYTIRDNNFSAFSNRKLNRTFSENPVISMDTERSGAAFR